MTEEDARLWSSAAPIEGSVVLAAYTMDRPFMRVKVLTGGKHVDAGIGAMPLPRYWKPTDDQTGPLHSEPKAKA